MKLSVQDPKPNATGRPLTAAALLFFSGAIALMYEVLWQRQFAFYFGNAAPATAALLAAYFTGLGFARAVLSRRAHDRCAP